MVIFHSYVSLPEGNLSNPQIPRFVPFFFIETRLKPNVFARLDKARRSADGSFQHDLDMDVFHKWGYPQASIGWFISWKIPIKNG